MESEGMSEVSEIKRLMGQMILQAEREGKGRG